MHFTDIFIKRPVLATVVSLVIMLLGARAFLDLSVREYPELRNAKVTVSVAYPGASAKLMEGFVTTPLERAIASAGGIDFLTSSTGQGIATISANLKLTKDPNEALTEISAKVNKLRSQMPPGAEDPVISVASAQGTAAMYIAFYSKILNNSQITDYLDRVVQPRLASVEGIESAQIIGASRFAMRIWLKPDSLAAYGVTASEVYTALQNNNYLSALGETKGNYVKIGLRADTDLHSAEAFRQMIIKTDGNKVVRLGDVANVVLGAESYDSSARWDGDNAIFFGINVRPDANVLDVVKSVREVLPDIFSRLPEGLRGVVGYDSTVYIQDAISEVRSTLIEAIVIVIVVIFLFLGSVRSSLIPAVTVPLALVGAMFLMLLLGFTFNLLTLLAMVLAIGMVVDDAIIVLENIHRHIERGMQPMDAAIKGARELVGPVIAMTITLMSVYAPIGFLGGITGKLFTEFAFTLAGAVLISGVIALTLTPMMCSRILKPMHGAGAEHNRLAAWLDRKFDGWRKGYKKRLHGALNTVHFIAFFGVLVLASCYFLFVSTPTELAPAEDAGFAILINETDGYSSLRYLDQYTKVAEQMVLSQPAVTHTFTLNGNFGGGGTNSGFTGIVLKPWSERDITTQEFVKQLRPKLNSVAGLRSTIVQPPSLPTPGQGYPVEFVLKSTASPEKLAEVGKQVIYRALDSKKFIFMASRLRVDRPEVHVLIDREKAALLGVNMRTLGADLSALLSGGFVNRFALDSRAYKVIPQVQRSDRINPEQIKQYYTRTASGDMVPLSTIVKLEHDVVPRTIEHAQQLNSNTLIGVQRPGVSLGEALTTLRSIADEVLPPGFSVDYAGGSRQFMQEGSALIYTFLFALIIIYLVLAAQFESFRDPIIMLVSVPMSISGALLVLNIFGITNNMQMTNFPGMTMNIYTQVGLITLIGVITKHGILIVEFANKLQLEGMSKREAIEEAASIRMRPVLMTTAALVVAMIPLLIATGPGAAARFCMGLVIASGMAIGTLFTLYVVPAVYLYLGRDEAKRRAKLEAQTAAGST